MTRNFSTYLDALRLLAALTVMGCHLSFPQFTGGIVPYQGDIAAMAVTTFFVLSGYVIAYVAVERETTVRAYAVSRLARVYSVALPAIGLVMALDWAGHFLGSPRALPMYQYHALWKYLPLFLTFSSQTVFADESVFTDHSFWSLSYEVWYYAIFAAVFFARGRVRWCVVPLLMLIAGPRILLLSPPWLLGCGLYFLSRRIALPRTGALLLFFISLFGLVAIRACGIDDWIDARTGRIFAHLMNLGNSRQFASQYLVGLCVAINFLAARNLEFKWLDIPSVRSVIVYAASFTFALYLAHRPLLDFYSFLIKHNPHSVLSLAILIVLVLLSTWAFGTFTEHRKRAWRAFFNHLLDKTRAKPAVC